MTGPVDDSQDKPLDPAAYKHQLLLLKSMHCARPVLYQGLNQFVQCMTVNLSGSDVQATVYLRGIKGGIDSSEIQIKTTSSERNGDGQSNDV